MRHINIIFGVVIIGLLGMCLVSLPSIAAEAGFIEVSHLNLLWAIPFIGLLLSIALFPLFAGHFWEHHYGKIALGWIASIIVPLTFEFGFKLVFWEVALVLAEEYIPFILLILALFTVSGGIAIQSRFSGTPLSNVVFLAIGTALASITGTTGAAMLLIRPLLKAIHLRQEKAHTVIFFIFLVANIGGSLSPIGDPPLFLGFLQGVDFFWPTQHLLAPMLLASLILLGVYYLIDNHFYQRQKAQLVALDIERGHPGEHTSSDHDGFSVKGAVNLLFLGGIVAIVIISGVWKPAWSLPLGQFEIAGESLVRDIVLLLIAITSWKITNPHIHKINHFSWEPMKEVAKLFIAIFLTMAPVLIMLRAGMDGPFHSLVRLVSDEQGQPNNLMYFWLTGGLSSFLDNAPTYLVFFNLAGGDAEHLMGPMATTLLAISAGAVFMGANSYIGNAPNFMVRSLAVQRGVTMPSFFGYMLWSGSILLPLFVLIGFLWFW